MLNIPTLFDLSTSKFRSEADVPLLWRSTLEIGLCLIKPLILVKGAVSTAAVFLVSSAGEHDWS